MAHIGEENLKGIKRGWDEEHCFNNHKIYVYSVGL